MDPHPLQKKALQWIGDKPVRYNLESDNRHADSWFKGYTCTLSKNCFAEPPPEGTRWIYVNAGAEGLIRNNNHYTTDSEVVTVQSGDDWIAGGGIDVVWIGLKV